jgi:hypothetical protein
LIKFKQAKRPTFEEAVQLTEKHKLKQISDMRYNIMVDDLQIGIAFHGNRGTIYIAEMINGEIFKSDTKKGLMAVLEGQGN